MFMNEPLAICTVTIIVLTSLCSVIGFRDPAFREKYLFSVPEILAGKEYYRLITSAFLHADWGHLVLNMLSLYLFGQQLELFLGVKEFLLIYIAAVLGGDLLSLWIHRQHEYRALGASGGVCGLIFSYVLLFPGASMMSFVFPIPIPAWLYAILFMVASFLGIKRQTDHIGHDAHLGGAIIGLWISAALEPSMVRLHPKLFLTISGLAIVLFVYLVKNPLFLPLSSFLPAWPLGKSKRSEAPAHRREATELDAVLEKISESGVDSLSEKEKALLNSVSEKYQKRADSKKPESDLII
jgi:membrane associated rhomboid family serine protease